MAFLLVGITLPTLADRQWALLPALFDAGLDYLYVRQPDTPALRNQLLTTTLQPWQSQLLLPFDRPAGFFRRHWTEQARRQAPADQRAYSTSVHSLADWPGLAGRVSLAFFSPLFPSLSKPGYSPTVPLPALATHVQLLRQASVPLPRLIGLGGVQASNIDQVRAAGFDGAAVLGTLWQAPDPVAAVRDLRAIC
ncbi:hypothetical protein GCM10027578_23540 [Spirosoma luteolum]